MINYKRGYLCTAHCSLRSQKGRSMRTDQFVTRASEASHIKREISRLHPCIQKKRPNYPPQIAYYSFYSIETKNIFSYNIMDLKELKSELFKRLEFGDDEEGKNNKKYYELSAKIINEKYPDEGWRIPQGYIDEMKSLEFSKLYEIRHDLNDDEGFNALRLELPNVKANKARKTAELEKRIPPENPKFLQNLYTSVLGKTNTADMKINKFNKETKEIQEEINDLTKIINDIETLIPVYEYKSSVKDNKSSVEAKSRNTPISGDMMRWHNARKRNETNKIFAEKYKNIENDLKLLDEKLKELKKIYKEPYTDDQYDEIIYITDKANSLQSGQSGGERRKSRRNRKSKKGKKSRKARKSRRKSNRRR